MNIHSFLPTVKSYLNQIDLMVLPGWKLEMPWKVQPLAQGEYNMNFLLQQGDAKWVLRVVGVLWVAPGPLIHDLRIVRAGTLGPYRWVAGIVLGVARRFAGGE